MPGPEWFWMSNWNNRFTLHFQTVLIQGDGVTALVNTGSAHDLGPMIHYHTTHAHPHDARWNSIPQDVLVHLVTDAWDRVRLLENEDKIAPGLRTWWAGRRHRATIAVEVDTQVGTVVILDAFFYYETVEDRRLHGINENMYEDVAAYERVRKADHRLPLYDPKGFQRYPNGVITPQAKG